MECSNDMPENSTIACQLEGVPDGWKFVDIKHLFDVFNGSTPKSTEEKYWGGDIAWITPADMNEAKYIESSSRTITNDGFDSSNLTMADPGDIILSCRAPIGSVNLAAIPLCTNQGCKTLKPKGEVDTSFYYYYLSCHSDVLNSLGRGTTFMELSTSDLCNLAVPFPPFEVQKEISNHLDVVCSKTDSIIGNQKVLIDKLLSLKQSIISETVTRGLDPDVPMRDSGIQWIGKIPDSWDVLRLRQIGKCQNGVSKSGDYFGTGSPFVTYSDVYNSISFSRSSGQVNSDESDRIVYSVKRGDVFFTRTSETVDEIGLTSVCTETIPDATFSGFLIRVRCNVNILYPEYAKYYFRSEVVRTFFIRETNLVTRASLSQDLLKNLPVFLPPMDIQIEIANHLDGICNKIDDLIFLYTSLNKSILSLKHSLIYEYVTGKRPVQERFDDL